MRLVLTSVALPVCVLLLVDSVGCMSYDIYVLTSVDTLVLLDCGAVVAFDCKQLFLTGVAAFTDNLTAVHCRMCLCFKSIVD